MSATDNRVLGPMQTGELDMCMDGARVVWNVAAIDSATIQIDKAGTAWPTSAVVSIVGSLDGVNFFALPDVPATITGAGQPRTFSVVGILYVAAEVTTVGSGTSPIPFDATLSGTRGIAA